MISKTLMQKRAKLSSFSHPDVIIGVLTDVWAGSSDVVLLYVVGVNDFVNVKTDLKFLMSTPSDEDPTILFS